MFRFARLFLVVCLLAAGCSQRPAPAFTPLVSGTVVSTPRLDSTRSDLPTQTSAAPTIPPLSNAPTESSIRASPTPDCDNGLQYVADLTVPDGALIARGSTIDKRWQVKNTGTCNWDERYKLELLAGTELGLPKDQSLAPARAGVEIVIRLMLTAPFTPGVYTSAWQAFDPLGSPFGDVIYIEFQVN